MARKNTPLDYRVESAIIQVCEDLTLDIEQTAQEICDEFANTDYEASFEAIVKELTEARLVQIEQNQFFDSIGAIREGVPQDKYNGPAFDQYVDGAESAYFDRLYVEAP